MFHQPETRETMSMPSMTTAIAVNGTVSEAMPDAFFRVALDNGHVVIASAATRAPRTGFALTAGERVTVEVRSDDLRRGRITGRMR
jgi:translation initiation factor IF-1